MCYLGPFMQPRVPTWNSKQRLQKTEPYFTPISVLSLLHCSLSRTFQSSSGAVFPLVKHHRIYTLTEFERGRVVGLREGGFSFRDIAERLGRNVSTVHDCCQQWPRDGAASRRSSSGWPRGTTEREDRCVWSMAVAHRTASAAEIRAAVGTTVTQRTVTNWLLQGQARRPVACIPLTPNH
ncbi:hypothetical protein AVEN_231147-1 [Araneus ventricosus]|uniref:Transposase IS30-like HTH domain-containing protein n=1 Tax=Araneus ventricosus TaxID=182803 RepID=A0A4Y2USI6_ARAVE|nr:hypothetical protein AVEN_41354-1 [Araneus ventricosus]GBO15119.1 hypothetical protein AVEN_187234-1 [Araneus ventricosus]GBO15171.1 hypothetical protein AVEN_40172-1 [Araneus ventricosus]GBO15174.1 hypothetical protein AVEN_231147-1 [Araneus ventricosus]